jgi:hypothetical protein
MALAVHADSERQTCFPSYQTIAKQLNMSKPTVLKAIKLIITLYLASKQWTQSPEGDPGPNLYALLEIPTGPLDLTGLPTWATIAAVEEDTTSPPEDVAPTVELSTEPEGVVNEIDHPSQPDLPRVVSDVYPNKNLLGQDVKNKSNGSGLRTQGRDEKAYERPQPVSYGRRDYTPLPPQALAARKALLRAQAEALAQQEERRT